MIDSCGRPSALIVVSTPRWCEPTNASAVLKSTMSDLSSWRRQAGTGRAQRTTGHGAPCGRSVGGRRAGEGRGEEATGEGVAGAGRVQDPVHGWHVDPGGSAADGAQL